MTHPEVTHSKEPIRLFRSDILEFFTHIHPAVVLAIWAPVAGYSLVRAIAGRQEGHSPWYIPAGFLLGLFLWTLAEYTLHRFLFHFPPHTPRQERVAFLIHGVHHAQPLCKTRLVMPPAASIPLAVVSYAVFSLILSAILRIPHWVLPLFSGFVSGYLAYDMIHYSLHHHPARSGYLKSLRSHHMRHHSQLPYRRFGVSSPLWDIVFGTRPA